jgi:hypothetical protein
MTPDELSVTKDLPELPECAPQFRVMWKGSCPGDPRSSQVLPSVAVPACGVGRGNPAVTRSEFHIVQDNFHELV